MGYKERRHAQQRLQREKLAKARATVLEHYGASCACCGTTDQLSIDHVNGDGHLHRQEVRGSLYLWLIGEGYPDGFQTLCKACNTSKGRGPACRIHMERPQINDLHCNPDHTAAIIAHLYGKPIWPAHSRR